MTKKRIFLLFFVLLLISPAVYGRNETELEVEPLFSLNFLTFTMGAYVNPYATLMETQLPKIGIEVASHLKGGFPVVSPRIWNYPEGEEDYEGFIPSFDEGGYDVYFDFSVRYPFAWNPEGIFDSSCNFYYRSNIYQYSNTTYDTILSDYLSELNDSKRLTLAGQLQEILAEDLPSIVFAGGKKLYAFSNTVSDINPILLSIDSHRAEKWKNTKDSVNYAVSEFYGDKNIWTEDNDGFWINMVYYGLFERNPDTLLMENVIASNEMNVSNDGLSFEIGINPDAYFSNGDPVTAYDVEFTYHMHLTPAVNSNAYSFLTRFFENNESIVALNADTVKFTITRPYGFVKSNLFSYGIVNKNLTQNYVMENGYNFYEIDSRLLTSCGPYVLLPSNCNVDFEIYRIGDNLTLVPNPYWSITSNDLIPSIYFESMFKNDAITKLEQEKIDILDFATLLDEELENITDITLHNVDSRTFSEMAINMRHPIIGTGELSPLGTAEAAKNIRTAINHIVPRESFINNASYGYPTVSHCPRGCLGFNADIDLPEYSQTIALEYMEKAGYDVPHKVVSWGYTLVLLTIALVSLSTRRRIRRKNQT